MSNSDRPDVRQLLAASSLGDPVSRQIQARAPDTLAVAVRAATRVLPVQETAPDDGRLETHDVELASPRTDVITSGHSGTLRPATWKSRLRRIPPRTAKTRSLAAFLAFAFATVSLAAVAGLLSSDGRDSVDRRVVLSTGAFQPLLSLSAQDPVRTIVFSPDGRTLAAGTGTTSTGTGGVTLWDVSDPTAPAQLDNLTTDGSASSVAFSPDRRTLAAGTSTGRGVTLWDVSDPTAPARPHNLTTDGSASSVAFSPDGRTLAAGTGNGGGVTLWEVSDPAAPAQLDNLTTDGSVFSVAFSPDGRTLAAGTANGGGVTLWEVSDPAAPAQLDNLTTDSSVSSVAFSADGRTLAAGTTTGRVTLWILR